MTASKAVIKISADVNVAGVATSFAPAPASAVKFSEVATLLAGVGNNQMDTVYAAKRTLTTGANENVDVSGSLTDPLGAVIQFVKIKAIIVHNRAANTTDITLKPAASNGFLGPFGAAAHALTTPPQGTIALTNPKGGWPVTAATGDLINIANSSGASADYDLIVVGTSA